MCLLEIFAIHHKISLNRSWKYVHVSLLKLMPVWTRPRNHLTGNFFTQMDLLCEKGCDSIWLSCITTVTHSLLFVIIKRFQFLMFTVTIQRFYPMKSHPLRGPEMMKIHFYLSFLKNKSSCNGTLARYLQLRLYMHRECRERFPRHRALVITTCNHGTCVTCRDACLTNGALWSWWQGERSRHSRRMRNPQFFLNFSPELLTTVCSHKHCNNSINK